MPVQCPKCSSVELVSRDEAGDLECGSCKTRFTAAATITRVPTMGTDELAAAFAAPATADGPTRLGERVGPYRIDGILGKGGMGIVYRAVHEQLQRVVALKMVRSLDDPEYRDRFLTEARAVAKLQHPHIVQIFEVGEAGGSPFFALELVDGGTLADLLEYGPLAADKAADLLRQVATAVEVAHRAGIVHRDLKPANILLTADGTPKVTDFGLAKQVDDPGLTRTGAILGTPSYMAPEQAEGGELSMPAAADVYALGGILYAATTGRPPFQAASVLETIEQVRHREPVAPRTLVPTLPVDLETIALKCLHKDPARRYASVRDLVADLGRFQSHQPILARPVSRFERMRKWVRRHPAPAALIAAAVLVPIGASLGWSAYQNNQSELRRQQQQEQALQASMGDKLEAALADMHAHIDASRWPEALAAAERATSVTIEGVDSDLSATAARFHADLAMIVDLEEIWLQQIRVKPLENAFQYEDSRIDYDARFRQHGFHAEVQSASEASASLAELPASMQEAVIVALEGWMFVAVPFGVDDTVRWVVETLQLSDPSQWRKSMRAATLAKEKNDIYALLEDPAAAQENPQSLQIVGSILKLSGEFERAHRLFRDSHARNPGNLWANHGLALLLAEMPEPRPEEALRYFTSSLALAPGNVGIMLNVATAHAALGEYEQADALFREVVRLEPDYADAHYSLGTSLWEQGDYQGAIAATRRALEILPDYASAHMNLGVQLAALGDQQGALRSYDRALEIEPDNPDTLNNRAITLSALDRSDEAIASAQKAVDSAPTHVNANYVLGRLHSASGNVEQAEVYYRRSIELTPERHAPYYNLASMLGKNDRDEDAIILFRDAIRLAPDHAETWCNYSDALQDAGYYKEALEAITRGHELGTARPNWPYPSAEWLEDIRKEAEFEARIEPLLSGAEAFEDAETRVRLARMLGTKKRFSEALTVYREAFTVEPALAEDLTAAHRYSAASCAALTAADAEQREAQVTELVRQACEWLSADLQLHRQDLEGTADERQTVAQKLNYWLRDERLAAIRDEERIAALPTEVQEICRQLWQDVRATLAELSGDR